MADIYVTAAAAQPLCNEARAAIKKPNKANSFGISIEMQASSPAVRRKIWSEQGFAMSRQTVDTAKLPPALRGGIAYAFCRAA